VSGLTDAIARAARRFPRPAPEDSIPSRVATLCAVLVAVAGVAIQEEFTAQAALASGAIAAGFGVSYLRRRARNWWLKTAVALLILVVARDFFAALVANPYDPRIPLVRLFLWLQVLHSFDLPARKDLKYSLASAIVLMAVGAVYARDAAFGVFLIPFALTAGLALVAMQGETGLPWRALIGPGVRLGSAVLLAAALIFALIPRGGGLRVRWMPVSPRLLWGTSLHTRIVNPAYPQEPGADPEQTSAVFNPQGYVGFSTFVDLRMRGTLDDTLVMRVRTTRPAFWRGLAFDMYAGRGWRMSDRAVEEYASDQPRIAPRLGPDEPWPAGSEQVIQTFYVEADQPNVIFAAYRPFEVFFPTGTIGVDRYAGLRSPVPLESGMIYSVISRIPAPTGALLERGHGDVPPSIYARYLQLPPIPARVRALAVDLTSDVPSPYLKAEAIRRYLASGFAYTLQAPPLPARADAVDEFLFVTRQGSCEIFASAMAVLLRAAGVPARLVTGYTTGTYNLFTGYYEVRNSDAHAWVEIFQPGVGWIEFEPTPGFASADALARQPAGQWLVRDAASWIAGVAAQLLGALPGSRSSAGPIFLLAATAGAVIAGLARTRRRLGARRAGRAGDGYYEAMLRVLARRGVVRAPATTPREFAASLSITLRPPAELITRTFEELRYGSRRLNVEMDSACRQALVDLRAAVGRGRQVAGR